MIDYQQTMNILRQLSVSGNPVATTYLHLLYNAGPGETQSILRQIDNFARSFTYEVGRVGPSEYKNATITPVMDHER